MADIPLKRFRLEHHYTQSFVAGKAGINLGQYSRIENGKERLTPTKAKMLYEAFEGRISLVDLLYPNDPPRDLTDIFPTPATTEKVA